MVTVEKVQKKIEEETPNLSIPPEQKTPEKKFYQKPIVWGVVLGSLVLVGIGIKVFKRNGSKIIDIQ